MGELLDPIDEDTKSAAFGQNDKKKKKELTEEEKEKAIVVKVMGR